MFRYVFRRFLLAVPTLLLVSVAIFSMGKCAPGDAVETLRPDYAALGASEAQRAEAYRRAAAEFGLDRPLFYFSVAPAAFPDTFFKIVFPPKRERLARWVGQNGHWHSVQAFSGSLDEGEEVLRALPDSIEKSQLLASLNDLRNVRRLENFSPALDSLQLVLKKAEQVFSTEDLKKFPLEKLLAGADDLTKKATPGRLWLPAIRWYGLDNQYHKWFAGFFTGQLGRSYKTSEPVWKEIRSRLGMTVSVVGLAMLLAYVLALPLGVWMARFSGKKFDRWTRRALAAAYAMPVFWFGALLVLVFATEGQGWKIFSGIAPNNPEDYNLTTWQWFLKNGDRLVLPVLVLTVHSLAVLALQMRGGVLEVVRQDFIRTARAKGLSEGRVFGWHAFRNALFPIITIFGSVFPAVFGGSLVVEYLFNIPGIGMKTHEAFLSRDFPVLFAILMISAALAMAGNLIADILYAWADPRVRFSKVNN